MALPSPQGAYRGPQPQRGLRLLALLTVLLTVLWALPLAPAVAEGLGSRSPTGLALRGQIYFLEPGTSRLPDLEALPRQGTIYASELNVTPRGFRDGFPGVTDRFEWFAIDYHGRFRVTRAGAYRFRLTSDDGAILRIDGETVVDNDGVHGPSSAEGRIALRSGTHDIQVRYFQGPAYEIALVLEAAFAGEAYAVFPAGEIKLAERNWLEVVMDTTTVIATFGLLAFMVERLTNGIALVLGYSAWWRQAMEVTGAEAPAVRLRNERNRRVALFAIGLAIAVPGAILMGIDILSQLQLPQMPELAGEAVTGLLVASGADPIRELVRSRDLRAREAAEPRPVQVAGTLVVQQSPAPGSEPAPGA